ncbi:MAG TPA: ribonuclease H-like domain-containing protein [Candidatus Kapabacteria bacterium]|nr:ribonuclease H-like domain-containing protein [Candidatus Kapabacteria bacterium]
MTYLVFDIETAALSFEGLDPVQQEYLLRGAENEEQQEEKKRLMSLNPLTARVVTLAMLMVNSFDAEPKAFVYSNCGDDPSLPEEEGTLADGAVWKTMPERALMTKWWEVLSFYHARGGYTLITFNGRGFDCPFLMLRSAALAIRPSRNLMDGTRWRYDRHVDLQEELSFHQFSSSGPTRRFNFDFYCKAFGIKSPKGEGITGHDVPEFWLQGRHREIAEYCLRDVRATWDLFKYWKRFLADFDGQ